MIIDAHAHVYPNKIALRASRGISDFYSLPTKNDGTVERLLEIGKKSNIDKFVIHSVATSPAQVDSINSFISETVRLHKERFIGFATLHPNSSGIPELVEKIISMNLCGIKLHPDFQHFDADSPEAFKIYEVIAGRLPLIIHAGDYRTQFSKPLKIYNIKKSFPELEIFAAHFGGWSEWDNSTDKLAQAGVYVDCSSSLSFLSPEKARALISMFGVDHVFFGSDYPMWNADEELKMLYNLNLDKHDLNLILGENFLNFMKLFPEIQKKY